MVKTMLPDISIKTAEMKFIILTWPCLCSKSVLNCLFFKCAQENSSKIPAQWIY